MIVMYSSYLKVISSFNILLNNTLPNKKEKRRWFYNNSFQLATVNKLASDQGGR